MYRGLPTPLWGEILLYVVEVGNLSPTKVLGEVTGFEMITGRKSDVRNLRFCECVAFAHVPKAKRSHKLSPKTVPTLFVGYATKSLGYRLLDVRSGKLIKRRDVSFREDITVESSYLLEVLAKKYEGRKVQLLVNVPFVPIPVDGIRDHE